METITPCPSQVNTRSGIAASSVRCVRRPAAVPGVPLERSTHRGLGTRVPARKLHLTDVREWCQRRSRRRRLTDHAHAQSARRRGGPAGVTEPSQPAFRGTDARRSRAGPGSGASVLTRAAEVVLAPGTDQDRLTAQVLRLAAVRRDEQEQPRWRQERRPSRRATRAAEAPGRCRRTDPGLKRRREPEEPRDDEEPGTKDRTEQTGITAGAAGLHRRADHRALAARPVRDDAGPAPTVVTMTEAAMSERSARLLSYIRLGESVLFSRDHERPVQRPPCHACRLAHACVGSTMPRISSAGWVTQAMTWPFFSWRAAAGMVTEPPASSDDGDEGSAQSQRAMGVDHDVDAPGGDEMLPQQSLQLRVTWCEPRGELEPVAHEPMRPLNEVKRPASSPRFASRAAAARPRCEGQQSSPPVVFHQ